MGVVVKENCDRGIILCVWSVFFGLLSLGIAQFFGVIFRDRLRFRVFVVGLIQLVL